jgi:DNA-binding transcriptional LysR family regulator
MKNLNELAVFSAVVEHGGFTAAANALSMQKSTVSRMVSRLEERLEVPLLVRTSRQLAVTDAGRELHTRLSEALGLMASAESVAAKREEEPSGVVRLTAMPDFAAVWLAPLVAEFARKHARISVELVLTTRVVDLVAERIDLAVRSGPLPDSSLVAQRIGTARRCIVASDAYLKRRGVPQTANDLASHDCLAYRATDGETSWRVHHKGRPKSIRLKAKLAADDFGVLQGWARRGLGITMLPGFVCDADLRAGRLVSVLAHLVNDSVPLFLVHPEGRHLSASVRLFKDFLVRQLQSSPSLTAAKKRAPAARAFSRKS